MRSELLRISESYNDQPTLYYHLQIALGCCECVSIDLLLKLKLDAIAPLYEIERNPSITPTTIPSLPYRTAQTKSTMDYSSLPNDPDHPAGADPWQSSPQPTNTTFNSSEPGSAPSSPLAKHHTPAPESQQQEYQEEQEPEPLSPSIPDTPPPHQQNGTGRAPTRVDSGGMPDIRFQGPPLTEEELRQQQLHQQRQQHQYQQALHAQQHQRVPGRYHQGARAGQRPPQYKLQAKVTGLERTGKKDPAIRFDIHVSAVDIVSVYWKLTAILDQPAEISHHTSQRHQAHTLRILQASRPSDIFEPRSFRTSCTLSVNLCRCRHRRRRSTDQDLNAKMVKLRL